MNQYLDFICLPVDTHLNLTLADFFFFFFDWQINLGYNNLKMAAFINALSINSYYYKVTTTVQLKSNMDNG